MSLCIYQGDVPVEGILCCYQVFVSSSIYHKRWKIMGCINSYVCVRNSTEKLYYCNYLPALKPTAFVTIFCLSNFLRMWWQVIESLGTSCSFCLFLCMLSFSTNAPELQDLFAKETTSFPCSVPGTSPSTNEFSEWSQRSAFWINQECHHKCQKWAFQGELRGTQSQFAREG